MVKRGLLLLLFCFIHASLLGDVKIEVSVSGDVAIDGQQVQALVKVIRAPEQKIDSSTFTLGGKPLEVSYVGEATQSSLTFINGKRSENNRVTTTFMFYIPPKPPGLHVLDPIAVDVDGVSYSTARTTYTIEKSAATTDFLLKAGVEGAQPVYPGQRLTLIYSIYFKQDVELTGQAFPLLEAEGMRKLGELQRRSYQSDGYAVEDLFQEVEALTPGRYVYGPSAVEGFIYKEDFFGRRQYVKPRLRAEAEAVTIEVRPFPIEGRPSSFDGAVGDFSMAVKMLTPRAVSVGDKVELQVDLYGKGELHTVKLPKIGSQPGFKGFFRASDLPPAGGIEGNTKRFVVEVRPLTDQIQEVPQIVFAYFNPADGEYHLIRSAPIPLTVEPLPNQDNLSKPVKPPIDDKPVITATEPTSDQSPPKTVDFDQVGRIVISGNVRLSSEDFKIDFFQSLQSLWIVPSSVLALILILVLTKRSSPQSGELKNEVYYSQAFAAMDQPDIFFSLLEKAFLQRLYEKRHIKQPVRSPADLEGGGIVLEVKNFLLEIENQRYTGKNEVRVHDVAEQARSLFLRI